MSYFYESTNQYEGIFGVAKYKSSLNLVWDIHFQREIEN
jgi:hypothetical protein